jgi:hypothetical protein
LGEVLADHELFAITDFQLEFIEDWSGDTFTPEEMHSEKCTNQTSLDTYCVLLADRANHCVKANDPKWWDFSSCMFENNGWSDKTGLSSDSEFEATVQNCTLKLESYSFADLKTCYTGAEGDVMARESAARTAAESIEHPTWMYVNGEYIGTIGPPNPSADLTSWANRVKKAICKAYTGTQPSACSSLMVV